MDHSKSSESRVAVGHNDNNNNNTSSEKNDLVKQIHPLNNNNSNSNVIRRRKNPTTFFSSQKTLLFVTSSAMSLLFCLLILPDVVEAGVDREELSRVEEDWLRSEKDVRTIENIISNLYGKENPFNLLVKNGVGKRKQQQQRQFRSQQQQLPLLNFVEKMEKRFAKHAQPHLLRPGNFEF